MSLHIPKILPQDSFPQVKTLSPKNCIILKLWIHVKLNSRKSVTLSPYSVLKDKLFPSPAITVFFFTCQCKSLKMMHAHVCVLSCVQVFATLWTGTHQAPLSMGFSSKNTGVCCHFLLQIFPTRVIKSMAPAAPALAGIFFTPEPPGKP